MRSPRILRRTLFLLAACLVGCSPSPDADEPPPHQVRRELAQMLRKSDHLRLPEFPQEGARHYVAEAKGPNGAAYQVQATTEGRTLAYSAERPDHLLRGRKELPEPDFDEKHPQLTQALRGLA